MTTLGVIYSFQKSPEHWVNEKSPSPCPYYPLRKLSICDEGLTSSCLWWWEKNGAAFENAFHNPQMACSGWEWAHPIWNIDLINWASEISWLDSLRSALPSPQYILDRGHSECVWHSSRNGLLNRNTFRRNRLTEDGCRKALVPPGGHHAQEGQQPPFPFKTPAGWTGGRYFTSVHYSASKYLFLQGIEAT